MCGFIKTQQNLSFSATELKEVSLLKIIRKYDYKETLFLFVKSELKVVARRLFGELVLTEPSLTLIL